MEKITITSGIYRGRKVSTPGGATHPMGSRERLALFNMLTESISDATILDAFAGSGALGIEALSRGAKHVVFVEKNTKAAQTILENLRALGIIKGAKVVKTDISNFDYREKFDVILADPPYDDFEPKKIGGILAFLRNGGILALSHPGSSPEFDGFSLIKSRKYAGATISIYEKK